jgi:hypothetical protein
VVRDKEFKKTLNLEEGQNKLSDAPGNLYD